MPNGAAQEDAAIGIYLMSWMTISFLFLYVSPLPSPPFSILNDSLNDPLLTRPTIANSSPSIACLRKNLAFAALFFTLIPTFTCLGASKLSGNARLNTAGGAFGIVAALIAFYIGTAELLGPEDLFMLPLGRFKPRGRRE